MLSIAAKEQKIAIKPKPKLRTTKALLEAAAVNRTRQTLNALVAQKDTRYRAVSTGPDGARSLHIAITHSPCCSVQQSSVGDCQ